MMLLYLAQTQRGGLTEFLMPMAVLFAIMYFLLIRPQKVKEKQHKEMISRLKKNDEVITSGGINGTIVGTKEKTVIIRVDENVKLEVQRSSIVHVNKKEQD